VGQQLEEEEHPSPEQQPPTSFDHFRTWAPARNRIGTSPNTRPSNPATNRVARAVSTTVKPNDGLNLPV
jgi:hypothetical protein